MSHDNEKTTMKYVRLGNSGLYVSNLILGCMSYGSSKWQPWVLDEEEGIKHIEEAWKHGINTFDTANAYSNGLSEVVLGKAIKKIGMPRSSVVVLTKVFFALDEGNDRNIMGMTNFEEFGYANRAGLSRKHIFDSVDDSLRRLGLDYIDVLQCHRFDYNTPIEETMQALHDVVRSGKVRYIGMSSCHAYQFHAMQNYAITNKLTPFISMQNLHNAVYREEEREMLPLCKMLGVGAIPWSPLARGYLTRPAESTHSTTRAESDKMFSRMFKDQNDSNEKINKIIEEIAKNKNASMAQVAVAYSLTKVTAPIIGSTKLERLKELIDAIKIQLTEEEIKRIEEPYVPKAVFGHA